MYVHIDTHVYIVHIYIMYMYIYIYAFYMYTLCVLKTWNVCRHGDQDVMLCLDKHLKRGHIGMNR